MKNFVIKILHVLLGYSTYLKLFSVLKIYTLKMSRTKSDFLFFRKTIGKEVNIVVIGACTGITTIPLARRNKIAKVFTYEPAGTNFKVLEWMIKKFNVKNVSAYNIGLGNVSEKREFILPVVDGVKKQGFAHIVDPTIKEYNDGIKESIEIYRLDDRKELKGIRIGAIKIVAQNFEKQILEGAVQMICNNHPVIYCELWTQDKRKPVLDLIRSYGYQIYYKDGGMLKKYVNGNDSIEKFIFKYEEG
jgi:FkbM family methyltransferase